MDKRKFDLVFSGKVAPGFELNQAKQNIQALFRIDTAKADVLFSGKSIVLKKGLDSDAANKYRAAMRKAGAVAFLTPVRDDNAAPATASGQSAKPEASAEESTSAGTAAPSSESSITTSLGAQPIKKESPRPEINAPDFGLASVGETLLQDGEKLGIPEVEIDVSWLSVKEQQGNLLDENEHQRPESVDVNIPDVEVAPAGSDVLRPEERKKQPSVEVDTSSLSVAPVGERLSKPSDSPPPPNTDHIKLEK